jgi:hypothetical protein
MTPKQRIENLLQRLDRRRAELERILSTLPPYRDASAASRELIEDELRALGAQRQTLIGQRGRAA